MEPGNTTWICSKRLDADKLLFVLGVCCPRDHLRCLCFGLGEIVFALIFAVELTLRFAVAGCDFFAGPERYWNIFDMTLILAQVSEQVCSDVVQKVLRL